MAKQKEIKCLSNDFINTHSKLKWECKDGHQWETAPDNIQQGTWCPICYQKNRYNKKNKN